MNLLAFAGVQPEDSAASRAIDEEINRVMAVSKRAHERLRHNLRNDRRFASLICLALGCGKGECAGLVPRPLVDKIEMVPRVVRLIEQSRNNEAITSLSETPLTS